MGEVLCMTGGQGSGASESVGNVVIEDKRLCQAFLPKYKAYDQKFL